MARQAGLERAGTSNRLDAAQQRVSEYVRDLVREDQKRQTRENLEALLLEATRSGPGREFTNG
jgi:hypothetical protein